MNRHENIFVACIILLAVIFFAGAIGLPFYHYVHHVVAVLNTNLKG